MVKIFQGDAKKGRMNGVCCAVGCGGGEGISQNIQEKHSIHQRRGGCIAANQLLSNYPKFLFPLSYSSFFSARREYLDVIRVELIAQPLAVDGEDGEVVRGVGGHHDPLPAQTERGGRRQLGSSLECPGK